MFYSELDDAEREQLTYDREEMEIEVPTGLLEKTEVQNDAE